MVINVLHLTNVSGRLLQATPHALTSPQRVDGARYTGQLLTEGLRLFKSWHVNEMFNPSVGEVASMAHRERHRRPAEPLENRAFFDKDDPRVTTLVECLSTESNVCIGQS